MEIEHFSHGHRLTLGEEEKKEGANEVCCFGCRDPIEGPAYMCSQCSFFLHKQCAELPREMLHQFHPPHPLTLYSSNPYKPGSCFCDACRKTCHGFVYHCAICKFDLGLECASLMPAIKYEGHDHLLSYFEKLHRINNKCNVCYTLCDASVIRCVPCQFNFHIHCFPSLPYTIKHKCHSCLLTLTNPLTFLTRSGNSHEFYCGACEKKGNPKESVYYCADCDYVAHIECVISEVLSSISLKRASVARIEETILAKLDEELKKLQAVVDHALAKLNEEIEKLRTEVNAAPAKLDQEITKLRDEVKAMKAKLELLESDRGQHGASEIPKVRCLTRIQELWSRKG